MAETLDAAETRTPGVREAAQFARLREIMSAALVSAPGWARLLAGADPATITGPEALAGLPVLRKTALVEMQAGDPPLGGLTTRAPTGFATLHRSPGPIHEPGMDTPDWWRFARAMRAAGIGAGDVVLNAFAYHLTPAGHMLESAARALGAATIPGGVGNTEGQAQAAAALGATAYAGTPDYLATVLEKADALGLRLAIDRALVSGGPLFPRVREGYAARGIRCLQCYGTADLGLVAYETAGADGPNPGMVLDEGVIVEIVRPGTGDPVPDGEVGEILVTTLNPDYPLFRFATGDMSAMLEGACPSGRTGRRIKGWMGRADQTTKVKGMFVRPEQVAEIVRRHPEIGRARLTVRREGATDAMVLEVETDAHAVSEAVAATMRDVLALGGRVQPVAPGSLPNDGKVIEDARELPG